MEQLWELTKPQMAVYEMEKYAGGTIGVLCGSVLYEGETDDAALCRTVDALYMHNDALRMRIAEKQNRAMQWFAPYAPRQIPLLRFEDPEEMDAYALGWAKEPIPLDGEITHIRAVRLPGHYGYLIKTHHLAADEWTMVLLADQFQMLLQGKQPVAGSYTALAESEREYFGSPRQEKDEAFFLDGFRTLDEVVYFSDAPSSCHSVRNRYVLDGEYASAVREYLLQTKQSPFALFLTALAVYYSRVRMNAEQFYIGIAVRNRTGAREKNTVGNFVNTVPLLVSLDYEKSFADNVTRIQRDIMQLFRHQRYNYGDIRRSLRENCGFSGKLYDVLVSYESGVIISPDVRTAWYDTGMQMEALQMHIDDTDRRGSYRVHFDYHTDSFSGSQIDSLFLRLRTLLFDAVTNGQKPVKDLELLPPDEKQKILGFSQPCP